jgi:protein-glutamine gamma-glutamyltransferase
MKLERWVQIQVGLLATVGAMLLGVARGDALLPLLVLFAAASSLVFTDALNWLRLNRGIANLAALLALFICLGDFLHEGLQGQLLAVANLLVYLQVILFYQRKNDRLYWQLIVLSLLQVVVAAALNVPVEFGLLLMVYAALAISTLTFFFLHREVMRCVRLGRGRVRQPAEGASAESRAPVWGRLLESAPRVTALLSGRRIVSQLAARGLFLQIVAMAVTTLVFSLVLFYSSPRLGISGGRAVILRARNLVGFSPELRLGQLRDVLQNNEMVMRISFRQMESGEFIRMIGDPYIRGAVLTDYVTDREEATWRQRRSPTAGIPPPTGTGGSGGLLRPPPGRSLVRQDIILEPLREPVLFAVFPAFRIDETPGEVTVDPITERLESQAYLQSGERSEYRYRLATTAFRGGVQVPVTPHAFRHRDGTNDWYHAQEMRHLRSFDARRFPRLTEIADGIVANERLQGASRADVARALRDHFWQGNDYEYTLRLSSIQRDHRLDPIEDFVRNHRKGYCTHYASALVLMLRSQGIPARLIVGFRSDEYNAIGGYYQVRQRHAHAWVEAFLEPEEVSRELPPGSDIGPYGGWLRLDPTPGSELGLSMPPDRTLVNVLDEFLDYAQVLWSDYVLGLTAKRQQESIYAPVSEKADPEAWSQSWDDLVERLQRFVESIPRLVAGPRMRIVVMILLLAGLIWCAALFRRRVLPGGLSPVSRWRALLSGQEPAADPETPLGQTVVFYRRFERLMARLELVRPPSQTPLEFAAAVQVHLEALPGAAPAGSRLPRLVVDAFYRVKYGNRELDAAEESAIDQGLTQLEQQVLRRETPE